MIDKSILEHVVAEYKKDFVSGRWADEKYKWEAVKHFKDHWNINASDFPAMFMEATEKTLNLLASRYNYPREMIKSFGKADPEAVRAMFLGLYDETVDISQRISGFQEEAEALRVKYNDGTWKQHFQNLNPISTYLWLHDPDHYYIYKYSECYGAARVLKSHMIPKRGSSPSRLLDGYRLYDEICSRLKEDQELRELLRSVMTEACDPDRELKTLTVDVVYFMNHFYAGAAGENPEEWFPADYDPEISTETWKELIGDKAVFTPSSLEIMKRLMDKGGAATCKQLSIRYGESPNFYNTGSWALAKRVAEKTHCPVRKEGEEELKWWPVLYLGKPADKEADGSFVWKLRDELMEALNQTDLSSVKLFVNERPSIWKVSHGKGFTEEERAKLALGQRIAVAEDTAPKGLSKVSQGERFMLSMKTGDYFYLCYGNSIRLLGQITSDELVPYEEKGEQWFQRSYSVLALSKNTEPYAGEKKWWTPNENSTCIVVGDSDQELFGELILRPYFDLDLDTLLNKREKRYTKEDFLKEVFMSGTKYETLISLLKRKKNLILQGAPGVGKTYAAKRLAYAMMKSKDDSRVEMVQFHQNYSYEDFVMGYKPEGKDFVLKEGIFYRFCQRAAEGSGDYFFIIDEINRGNLSKIFGELLMLIERDYRGHSTALSYNGQPFTVPDNVYLIGMMNTADRSLAMIDYALRRRFGFFEMEPGFQSEGFKSYEEGLHNETFCILTEKIQELNRAIVSDPSLGRGFCIGHSYFCGQKVCTEQWMREVVEYDIIPTLNEYWFDEPETLSRWENILRGVFND